MATALGGTVFPPWEANDFSCALNGTFALTVEPGEKGTPANVSEPAVAASKPAWSSTINTAAENSRLRTPQNFWQASRIMLFGIVEQKTCGTKRSNLT
jgi:hypothetical protein